MRRLCLMLAFVLNAVWVTDITRAAADPMGLMDPQFRNDSLVVSFDITPATQRAGYPVVLSYVAKEPTNVVIRLMDTKKEQLKTQEISKKSKGTALLGSAAELKVGKHFAIFEAKNPGLVKYAQVRIGPPLAKGKGKELVDIITNWEVTPLAGRRFDVTYALEQNCTVKLSVADSGGAVVATLDDASRARGQDYKRAWTPAADSVKQQPVWFTIQLQANTDQGEADTRATAVQVQ